MSYKSLYKILFIIVCILIYVSGSAQTQLSRLERSKNRNDIPLTTVRVNENNGDSTFYMKYHSLDSILATAQGVTDPDSIYISNDTILLRDGSGFVKLSFDTLMNRGQLSLSNDTLYYKPCASCGVWFGKLPDGSKWEQSGNNLYPKNLNGNVSIGGIGTFGGTKLYIESDTFNSDHTVPFTLFLNKKYEGGTEYDGENHIGFQAGITRDYRRYLIWNNYQSELRWAAGINAGNTWIHYDALGGHRMWFPSGRDQYSAISASAGGGDVKLNWHPFDTLGSGGLTVYDGLPNSSNYYLKSDNTGTYIGNRSGSTNKFAGFNSGGKLVEYNGNLLTNITATSPIFVTSGSTPNISVLDASAINSGVVTTFAQTFSGDKSVIGNIRVNTTSASQGFTRNMSGLGHGVTGKLPTDMAWGMTDYSGTAFPNYYMVGVGKSSVPVMNFDAVRLNTPTGTYFDLTAGYASGTGTVSADNAANLMRITNNGADRFTLKGNGDARVYGGLQVDERSGAAFSALGITTGGKIVDLGYLPVNQLISTSGAAGNITLSNGGGTLNLNVNDADSDPANEIQTISKNLSTKLVTLSNGGGSFTDEIGPTYTAGTGISIASGVISNTGDVSNTNEIDVLRVSGSVTGGGKLQNVTNGFNQASETSLIITGATASVTSGINGSITWTLPAENDPTVASHIKNITTTDISNWNNDLVGPTYTNGTGISISGGNVISNTGVINVTATSPIFVTSGSTPNISVLDASAINSGVVTTFAQTFSGDKSVIGNIRINTTSASQGFTRNMSGLAHGVTGKLPTDMAWGMTDYSGTAFPNYYMVGVGKSSVPVMNFDAVRLNTPTGTYFDLTAGYASGTGTVSADNAANLLRISNNGADRFTLKGNGDVRLYGALYNASNSSGTSGQVLTSQGSGAWTWADANITNIYNSNGTVTGTRTVTQNNNSIQFNHNTVGTQRYVYMGNILGNYGFLADGSGGVIRNDNLEGDGVLLTSGSSYISANTTNAKMVYGPNYGSGTLSKHIDVGNNDVEAQYLTNKIRMSSSGIEITPNGSNGSSGQVLTTNGSTATWQNNPAIDAIASQGSNFASVANLGDLPLWGGGAVSSISSTSGNGFVKGVSSGVYEVTVIVNVTTADAAKFVQLGLYRSGNLIHNVKKYNYIHTDDTTGDLIYVFVTDQNSGTFTVKNTSGASRDMTINRVTVKRIM